jgi:hypothetical protein
VSPAHLPNYLNARRICLSHSPPTLFPNHPTQRTYRRLLLPGCVVLCSDFEFSSSSGKAYIVGSGEPHAICRICILGLCIYPM